MVLTPTDLSLNLNRLLKNPQKPSKNLATRKNHLYFQSYKWLIILLLRQGSNLNFPDPESDVLPITPRSSLEGAKIYEILKNHKKLLLLSFSETVLLKTRFDSVES